jgi:hypothetical protein
MFERARGKDTRLPWLALLALLVWGPASAQVQTEQEKLAGELRVVRKAAQGLRSELQRSRAQHSSELKRLHERLDSVTLLADVERRRQAETQQRLRWALGGTGAVAVFALALALRRLRADGEPRELRESRERIARLREQLLEDEVRIAARGGETPGARLDT